MARSSQTELAVLGALSVEPMTGYAIHDAIRDILGHFWSESFGQIYPTLAGLTAAGFVSRDAGGRARSSTYAITEAGRGRLVELLRQPVQQTPPRNGLMLRLFFGRALGVQECRDLLVGAGDEARQRLVAYQRLRAEVTADPEYAADQPYWLMTISAGEHAARATIAWADECLATLATVDTQTTDTRATTDTQATTAADGT